MYNSAGVKKMQRATHLVGPSIACRYSGSINPLHHSLCSTQCCFVAMEQNLGVIERIFFYTMHACSVMHITCSAAYGHLTEGILGIEE